MSQNSINHEDPIAQCAQRVRRRLRVGRQWRRATWDVLFTDIRGYVGTLAAAGAPVGYRAYVEAVSLAIEYLNDRPNPDRSQMLLDAIHDTMQAGEPYRVLACDVQELMQIHFARERIEVQKRVIQAQIASGNRCDERRKPTASMWIDSMRPRDHRTYAWKQQ